MSSQLVSSGAYLNISHIRHFITDRTAADNDLDLDLRFSDDEISKAFFFAALTFNGEPPYIAKVKPEKLPVEIWMIYCVCYHAYLAMLQRFEANDIDYSADGVTVDLQKRRIEHLRKNSVLFRDMALEGIRLHKKSINIARYYGALAN